MVQPLFFNPAIAPISSAILDAALDNSCQV